MLGPSLRKGFIRYGLLNSSLGGLYTKKGIMPLRARFGMGLGNVERGISVAVDSINELPGDDPDDVVFKSMLGARIIELNRPRKLNSLDGSMVRKIIRRLHEWENSSLAELVIIRGAGRAFCAGGDVAAVVKLIESGNKGKEESRKYFMGEYQLDHMIATYGKPYIALIDGITMGGGVGLSIHAPLRVATENTVFAMPETTIGFFPDVGASFFLPRLDGNVGTYLALTSHQIRGVDVFYHGIATHYIDSSSISALQQRLGELKMDDGMSMENRLKIISSTIDEFSTGLPESKGKIQGELRRAIDECFNPKDNIETICDKLSRMRNDATRSKDICDWAEETLDILNQRSPISIKVTLEQMRRGKSWSIGETFNREYGLASKFIETQDFITGVRARLIDKTEGRPHWNPDSFKSVDDKIVQGYFNTKDQLPLIETHIDKDYKSYPYEDLALPKDSEIVHAYQDLNDVEKTIKYFLFERNGKIGIREKVSRVLDG